MTKSKTGGGAPAIAKQPAPPAAAQRKDSARPDAPPAAARTPPPAAEHRQPTGKLGQIVTLMSRARGATIGELTAATNWQKHSVRGAISGNLRRQHGYVVLSEVGPNGRFYRIVTDAPDGATTTTPSSSTPKAKLKVAKPTPVLKKNASARG
jgi:hypothetical protein